MLENSLLTRPPRANSTLKSLAFLATLFIFCADSNQQKALIAGTSFLGGIFVKNTSKKNKSLCLGLSLLSCLLAYFLDEKPRISQAP